MTPLIKLAEVMALTKKSRSSVYAEAKDGRFPKPIKLSERSSAWVVSEVQDWIESKIQQRDREAA